MEGFPPERFARRRELALERLGSGALVLPAASVRYRSGDSEYPYRADSELFYLTGFGDPGAVAVLRGFAEEERFVLFVRPRDPKAEAWGGTRPDADEVAREFGADAVYPLGELEERLPEILGGADRVFHRPTNGGEADGGVGKLVLRALRRARRGGSRTGSGPRGVIDPGEVLDELRLVKDDDELQRLRSAAEITVDGFRAAMAATHPGAGEWEIEATLEYTFRMRGGRAPAFATIVGSGPNACVLHYARNDRRIIDGDLVLVDGGAEFGMYAGDISRTFPASGRFRPEQRVIYDAVARAQRAAIAAVREGTTIDEIHHAAVQVLVEGLVDAGVLSGDPALLHEEKAHEPFFPHRTSHWLGLDVHDVGDYARDGTPRPLVPGMVLTVEPGLYFPPGIEAEHPGAARFAGIGVRIEDDVLVTPDGPENLTGALPVEADEVAALVGRSAA
jgi:Xaa-Pro aminopeptidase